MNKIKKAPLLAALTLVAVCGQAMAAEPAAAEAGARAVGLGLSAALTMALCVLGSGYAVGRIGSAAMGAAAEKPELLMRSLLFVALAEGLAVLGFVISMMLLQKI
jgi:V/A-type H+-transporting ATPase subunit K